MNISPDDVYLGSMSELNEESAGDCSLRYPRELILPTGYILAVGKLLVTRISYVLLTLLSGLSYHRDSL